MQLSTADIRAIRKIVREDFGVRLSPQKCEEVFGVLVEYLDVLAKVVHRDNLTKRK